MESGQYNTAIKRTSQEKLYNELGLESLKLRKLWCICTFYRIKTTGLPIWVDKKHNIFLSDKNIA